MTANTLRDSRAAYNGDLVMDRSAVLSVCERYRYVLRRMWDADLPLLPYIMLNPSTADAAVDDATIRVCIGRAIRMRYGGILVLNLFAFRATDPRALKAVSDPVGPNNDGYLSGVLLGMKPKQVIAAWGDHGALLDRDKTVLALCRAHGVPLYCLGTTKAGNPRHPLRIAYSVEPRLMEPA